MKKVLKKYAKYVFYALIIAFISASGITLYIASITESFIFSIQSVPELKMGLFITIFIAFSLALFFIFKLRRCVYRCLVPISLFCFSILTLLSLRAARPYYYIVMAALVIAFSFVYKEIFHDRKTPRFDKAMLYVTVLVMTVLMTVAVTVGSIVRMYVFNATNFDLGLFAQMYEYMANDFTQNTTLERNELMSHFEVHFSPVYYLLLPFYMIFRRPEFLLGAQAALCFSGVIPILLLCKKQKYGGLITVLVSGAFLCYPTFTGACFYDFHENFFLVPFILWLLYFLDNNKILGIIIFALLMLSVKEDAGLYVIFIGLYALFNKKIRKSRSIPLLLLGIIGFGFITAFINLFGEGIKVSRYSIYLYSEQDSLSQVIVNVIKNPAFFFDHLLNEQKLLFLIQMLLPTAFISLRTRRFCDLFLISPLILINLASDYPYQSDIGFQYVFGTGSLIFFLYVKNLRYSKKKTKVAAAVFMASAICLLGSNMSKYNYAVKLIKNPDYYAKARQVISEIPRDKVIYANTFFTPFLFDCKEVYMYPPVYTPKNMKPDYYLLDSRSDKETLSLTMIELQSKGFVKEENDSFVIVYKRAEN